mgnify:CR=1 FL=1
MNPPPILSYDIETYGKCEKTHDGSPLPEQTYFHPYRSLLQDGVDPRDLVLTCSITFPKADTRINGEWSLKAISLLEPGDTFVLNMWDDSDRRTLQRWFDYADTLLGANLSFDLTYLRCFHPYFFNSLYGRHTLIDYIVCRYLWSEISTAGSLKDFGPLHGLYAYDPEDTKSNRFPSPLDSRHRKYNAEDTHNTITAIAHSATLILESYGCATNQSSCSSSPSVSSASLSVLPATSKLSAACVSHYSDLIWSVVRMLESGIPLSYSGLSRLESFLVRSAEQTRLSCLSEGLILSGKGSPVSKVEWVKKALDAADTPANRIAIHGTCDRSIYDPPPKKHPRDRPSSLVEFTDKKGELSANDNNRTLAQVLLPTDSPYTPLLRKWSNATRAEKLVSTYTYPLLRHARKDPLNQKNRALPCLSSPNSSLSETPTSQLASATTSTKPAPSTDSTCSLSPPTPRVSARTPSMCSLLRTPPSDLSPDVLLAFPTIYLVPSRTKDSSGDSGGQKQSRLSFKGPPAQTWPPLIKKQLRSRFKGGSVVVFDLSQIELRVAGILSGEPSILRNYLLGLDLHTDRCLDLFGEPALIQKYGPSWRKNRQFKEAERQWGKKFNFEDLYLAGPGKMQRIFIMETGLFLPLSFFEKVVASRQRLRPVLGQWQSSVVALAKHLGYIELPFFGQSRRFLHGADANAIGEIVNFPIQTTAANVMHAVTARLFSLFPPLRAFRQKVLPFLNVYDSLFLDVHPHQRASLPGLIEEAFEYVRTKGYWRKIQEHYNRECPLVYEIKEAA